MYTIETWTLVALVVLPFILGVLVGIRIAYQKIVLKIIKTMPEDELNDFLEDEVYDEDK